MQIVQKDAHKTIQQLIENYGDNSFYNTYKADVNKMLKSYGFGSYYGLNNY